ncbi:hypothetical protein pb186bvf_004061 [Paramecium bursaria]
MGGFVECVTKDFRTLQCYMQDIIKLQDNFLFIYKFDNNDIKHSLYILKRQEQDLEQKESYFVIYIFVKHIYNMKREPQDLFFLQLLFESLYQTYLIYYFGRKITIGRRFEKLVLFSMFYILLFSNGATFIYFIVEFNKSQSQQLCKLRSFVLLRSFGFVTQLIFTMLTYYMYEKIMNILRVSFLRDDEYYERKRKLQQLKILVYLQLIGSFILFCLNFVYYFHKDDSCHLIPHIGNTMIGESLDTIIKTLLKILTIFIPFGLALIIFKPVRRIHTITTEDPEQFGGEDFVTGLGVNQSRNIINQ